MGGLVEKGYASGNIQENDVKHFLTTLERNVPDFESKDGIFKPLEKYLSLQEEAQYFEWLEETAIAISAYGLWLILIVLVE